MKIVKAIAIMATVTACEVANASFTGKFYYANGSLYTTINSGNYGNSFNAALKPTTDFGAPSASDGWSWIGWYWGAGNIAAAYEWVTSGMGMSDFTRDYYSYYSRTNKYMYYTSSGTLSEHDWVQSMWNGTDAKSRLDLPSLYGQAGSGWVPQGWTDKDTVCNSSDDIKYATIASYAFLPPLNIGRNLRGVYSRSVAVSFDGNGATSGSADGVSLTQWLVAGVGASGTFDLPENSFTKSGYAFSGWSQNDKATTGNAPGTAVTPSGEWLSSNSQKYYAIWAANQYTVTYDANGGSGNMSPISTSYDAGLSIASNEFTKTAFVFKGWATTEEGDVAYLPGQVVSNLTEVADGEVVLFAVWDPLVVPETEVSASENPVFCGDSHTVTLTCPLEGATIYYTTNGVAPRTTSTFEYTGPIVIYGSVEIVAVAMREGVKSEYTRVTITQIAPVEPVIAPADGSVFRTETCEVSITCATEGADIYYTLDGSTPQKATGIMYSEPFVIENTTTVKAIAVGGPYVSKVVTVTLTKNPLSLAEAAGDAELAFESDENAPWQPTVDESAESGFSAQSGEIGMRSTTWMETSVLGSGTFSFNWKVDCEKDESGKATWDRLMVFTNEVEAARIDGTTEWQSLSFVFKDQGEHTIRWEFYKDDYDEMTANYSDCGWISGVTWTVDDPIPFIEDPAELLQVLSQAVDGEKLLGELTTVSEYNAFRSWVDGKGLSHSVVKSSPNAWLSYMLDSSDLMVKQTAVVSGDIAINSFKSSGSTVGAFEMVVSISDAEIGPNARLAEALGIEGTSDLKGVAFSSNDLSVTLERLSDGKAKATVKPTGSPSAFFIKIKALK